MICRIRIRIKWAQNVGDRKTHSDILGVQLRGVIINEGLDRWFSGVY